MRFALVALLAALALAGCATITKGTSQIIAVDTPGVPGAMCTITTQSGPQGVTTPGTITLAKGSSPLPISCTKECYLTGQRADSSSEGNTRAVSSMFRVGRFVQQGVENLVGRCVVVALARP